MKRINATCYTREKIAHLPLRFVRDPDGYLFSNARYRTKILPSDLPEWFVPCYIYKSSGYLSAKGVKHLVYKPNYSFTNHLHKDDLLFISYDKPLIPVLTEYGHQWYDGQDHILYGSSIVSFLDAVQKYSGYDISEIQGAIQRKRQWYIEHNPPEERYEL